MHVHTVRNGCGCYTVRMKGSRGITGFTLFEVLVAVSLLGSLALGSVFGVTKQFVKIRDAQRKLHLKMLGNALDDYADSMSCYPERLPACGTPFHAGSALLLASTPCDPLTGNQYPFETAETSCPHAFRMYTTLEIPSDPAIPYVGCQNGCGPLCVYNYGINSSNTDLTHCNTPDSSAPTAPAPSGSGEYVCAPGIGNGGHCVVFEFPELSDCPKVYLNDPSCANECGIRENHCKNSRGKNK